MIEILSGIVLVLTVMAATWWLSGYDLRLTGDNTAGDYLRRGIRCAFTWLLLVILLLLPASAAMVPVVAFFGALLALTWGWCLAEFVARSFQTLVGMNSSDRKYDPLEHTRKLDELATLL